MRLKDKVCVITGTGASMGRAAAIRFAQEGAVVVGCDTTATTAQETVDLVRSTGGKMSSLHPVDLATMEACQRLVDFTIRGHGWGLPAKSSGKSRKADNKCNRDSTTGV